MQGLLTPPKSSQSPSPRKQSRLKLIITLSVIAILGGAAAFFWTLSINKDRDHHGKEPVTSMAPVATVTAHTVGRIQVTQTVSASGTVAARHTVDIGSELNGLRITEVNVDEGDFVRRGQVLARMSSDLLEAQLSRERASLNGAIASVEKTRQPNRVEEIAGLQAAHSQALASISQAEANVKRSEANAANLHATAQSFEILKNQGAVSLQDARDKATAASMADSEVLATKQQLQAAQYAAKQAEERLLAARAGGRPVDVSISQANVGQIRATIRQIEAQLSQTIVRAPSDGIITKRNAEVGEITGLGQAMFTMAKAGELELRAQVQEIELPTVQIGARVTITPASPDLQPIEASVREVSPVVDSRTRFGTVYIDILASSGLKEGMYASSKIQTGTQLAIAVPTKAVKAEQNEKAIFVLEGNRVSKRAIETGSTNGTMIEVRSGLRDGEQIVVAGAGFLKDGDYVAVAANTPRLSTEERTDSNGL